MEGVFLAEGELAWIGEQKPNHFNLPGIVHAHCQASTPSYPPVPTLSLQRKARTQKMPLTHKPISLVPK